MIDFTSLIRDLGPVPLAIGVGVIALLIYSIVGSGKNGGGSGSGSSGSSGGSSTPPPAAPPSNPTGGA